VGGKKETPKRIEQLARSQNHIGGKRGRGRRKDRLVTRRGGTEKKGEKKK